MSQELLQEGSNAPVPHSEPLTLKSLQEPKGLAAVGLVASAELRSKGVCTLFVNREGFIELLPAGELELDLMPEQESLQVLLRRGYSDDMLQAFLQGRDTRRERSGQ